MKQAMAPGPLVHVLDDDAAFRLALDSLFRSVALRTRLYGSPHELLTACTADEPGCIVLDVRLPGTNGLDLQRQIQELGIRLPVILITGHGDIPMSVRAMKAGAVDFLAKPFRDQDLLDAVSAAIKRDCDRRAVERELTAVTDRFATLTARERDVMLRVTAGKMNKEVAGELGLSEITVKIHRGAVMRKMQAGSLADLVRMADALKLTSLK
jgi:FixJ family two-component response regulator